MSLKSFLSKIGLFFAGLFNAAAKAYSKLAPEIQEALKDASGILDLINKNVELSPDFIIEIIQKKYPNITKEVLHSSLKKVEESLNIAKSIEGGTLEGTIENLAAYLNEKQGGIWAGISSMAAKVLALALAPDGTKWAVFESLMEFVYQKFIKK